MMSKLGLPIVLTSYKYNVKRVVDTINEQNCTHAMIVPTMTIDILSYLEKTNSHLPSLKCMKLICEFKCTLFEFHIDFFSFFTRSSDHNWFSSDACRSGT